MASPRRSGPVGDEGRDQEGAGPGHHGGGLFVDHVAVLDGARAGADGALDGLGGIGVDQDVGVGAPGLVDGGGELVVRILKLIDGIGGRGHPAAGHDLDLVGAEADLVAHRLAHLGDTVGDSAQAADQVDAGARRSEIGRRPGIAVSAGLADGASADEQPGPGEQALLDGLAMTRVGAGGIANRGEAAHQDVAQHVPRDRRLERRQDLWIGRNAPAHGGHHDMDVAVDEARHEGPPAQVDDPGPGRVDDALAEFGDVSAPDQELVSRSQGAVAGLQHREIAKENVHHPFHPPMTPGRGVLTYAFATDANWLWFR